MSANILCKLLFKHYPSFCAHIIIMIRNRLCDVCFASSSSSPDLLAVLNVLALVGWMWRDISKGLFSNHNKNSKLFKILICDREVSERALREPPIFSSPFKRRLNS